ncbi:hypothetical protein NO932_04615 [Pelagibacterium sp. 26DY04]|uniref:hypothetical protein n=1 Tax=Pelagibacterium sp. 26DY04 TaxID=2967130 RepID=UPI0028151F4A|nr:hypothetical protein [Pelagibacterium sp. 26DY04]WMT87893.1 hypothetical protein NO932_04615 [Pelagibacterium sp. 26DY04]
MRFDRQPRPSRTIALHYRVGAVALLMLAAILGAGTVRADGLINTDPPPLSMLVKFDDRQYQIAYSDQVSLEPISTAVVRKVGYGHVTEVNIATTSTGTYSSDGLASPHVLYPGIEVARVYEDEGHYHWPYHQPPGPGFSIFSLGRDPVGGGLVVNAVNERGVRSCSVSGSFASCYRTY